MSDYRRPEDVGGEYHFHVGRNSEYAIFGSSDAYQVHLPHQCDEWLITQAGTKDQAIGQMEQFIAEAQAALAELREVE